MSNVWYEDPKTGDIYQDHKDSKGRTVRTWRRSYPREGSRAESSSTPRTRRESVYGRPSDESTSNRQREKSRVREPIRGGRRPSHAESDRRQAYPEVDRRFANEPGEAYFDPTRQASSSYQPRDGFESSSPSRQFSSTEPRHLSPRPFDPGTGDSLAESFDALHVSSDQYYTHSPIAVHASVTSATRDWQPPAVSSRREETTWPSSDRDVSQPIYSDHEYHEQDPLPLAQTQQEPPSRIVKGTAGTSERIDSSYKVRNKDWREFFRIGRVFSTLWTDSLGNNAGRVDPTFVSEVKYGERVYSKIRRFIVVREGDRSVSCLPVTSYANEGIRKSGILPNEHGFIYSKNKPKRVEEMCSKPLKLNIAQGAAHLKDPSLVNYGKVYNVETNVKVKNVGTLDEDSKDTLIRYYRRIFGGFEDPDPAGLTPRPSDAVLAGVGAALNTWPAPVPPGSYMPASTSGSGFASTSAMSGYPPPPSTVYETPSTFGGRSGSAYYGPSSQYETLSSVPYAPSSHTYGMGSALYPDPYDQPSMHSQAQYPSTQMTAFPHGLMYSSDNTMDPSRRYSTAQYPSSNRDSHYGEGSSTAVPSNAQGYSSGFYDQQPSQYPSTTTGSSSYPQPGSGYGPSAEPYPPPGGYDSRPPYSGSALPSAYDDDIDLSVDPAHEEALARKRRENRSDGRRRHPGR